MDWSLAIDINREALKRVVAALVAMAGFAGGDAGSLPVLPGRYVGVDTLPRRLHRAVLRLLRPAEAAARRLVIMAARDIVVAPPCPRPRKAGKPSRPHGCAAARTVSFPLLDPLRDPLRRRPVNKARSVPRIWAPGCRDPLPVPPRREPSPHDPVDAGRLGRRLSALGRVLDDLPRAARHFARWRARTMDNRDKGTRSDAGRLRRRWPLKPGLPPGARRPGSRRREDHPVDEILRATHGLALWAMTRSDTS